VKVKLKAQRSVPFIQFFTGTPMDIEVEATAALVFQGESCVISLESTAVTGITFSGSTQVNLGCGVSTNSTATNAVVADGSSRVVASPVAAVGGVPASSSYVGSTLLLPNSFKQDDPFVGLPDPAPPTSCSPEFGVQPNQTRTATPGCYRGMDIKGTLILEPGSEAKLAVTVVGSSKWSCAQPIRARSTRSVSSNAIVLSNQAPSSVRALTAVIES